MADPATIDDILLSWNIPQVAREFLSNIKYSDEATHHSHSFLIENHASSIDEYVVSGKNDNGKIVVSYVHANSQGNLV